jgi:hypothetical protein
MNLYFLVEGQSTEKKVYPAWLSHLLPELNRVNNYDEVDTNNFAHRCAYLNRTISP